MIRIVALGDTTPMANRRNRTSRYDRHDRSIRVHMPHSVRAVSTPALLPTMLTKRNLNKKRSAEPKKIYMILFTWFCTFAFSSTYAQLPSHPPTSITREKHAESLSSTNSKSTLSQPFQNSPNWKEAQSKRQSALPSPVVDSAPSEAVSADNDALHLVRVGGNQELGEFDFKNQLIWWSKPVAGSILERPDWVKFDMETVLLDTLDHSPRIRSLTHGAGMALERIVQQDAAFDPTMMLGSMMGKTNDPVGNTLTTGGAARLIEDSMNLRGGLRMNGRRGTELGLNQELGLLNSNSTFFSPNDQGNARLGVSLTQPLLSRGGQVYNERLVTQARIDSKVTWQEMRGDVEQRIAEVMSAYWRLYEARCQLLQQQQLLDRGERIDQLIRARGQFDSSRIEMAKARGRVARRRDQLAMLRTPTIGACCDSRLDDE